ncbi:MAG: toxin co-regulated pilus biosynthesis Q family protein [Rickettsiales bacterium]|jgi:hypothetical protein|nr:toxin co-regulated pilus biosynthesis Q family protein [Rickettsiales bacterium]
MRKILIFALAFAGISLSASADWSVERPMPIEPTWPESGTDAYVDMDAAADRSDSGKVQEPRGRAEGWTGGPSYTPPNGNPPVLEGRVPDSSARMPLATKDLIMDDGVRSLSASAPPGNPILDPMVEYDEPIDDITKNPDAKPIFKREVSDWVAKEGLTLREVLRQWSDMEGWELVWNTKREYPLKASAIFRGRYKDVSAALVRTFERAQPSPHAKYFMGNKVLVISTLEEHDGN